MLIANLPLIVALSYFYSAFFHGIRFLHDLRQRLNRFMVKMAGWAEVKRERVERGLPGSQSASTDFNSIIRKSLSGWEDLATASQSWI